VERRKGLYQLGVEPNEVIERRIPKRYDENGEKGT